MFDDQKVRAVIALMGFAALIGGFFCGLITSEVFVPIVLIAIQHYFAKDREKSLQDQIDNKDADIRALASGKAQIVNLQ